MKIYPHRTHRAQRYLQNVQKNYSMIDTESEITTGSYVKWIQSTLNKALQIQLDIDGIIGPKTRSAIRAFQRREGLVVDGIVGPNTEKTLNKYTGQTPPVTVPSAPTTPLTGIRARIVHLANQEWNKWNQGAIKETDASIQTLLKDYWVSGTGYLEGYSKNLAWSATFISWVMRKAGAGSSFKYSTTHTTFTFYAKENRLQNNSNPFKAYRINERKPEPGDIVVRNRNGSSFSYENVQPHTTPSHSDIVVSVKSGYIEVIGGNVSQSVSRKRINLDSNGYINSPDHFAIIKIEDQSNGLQQETASVTTPSDSCVTLDKFGFDSATLTSLHKAAIDKIARQILQIIGTSYKITKITVTGYTDTTGKDAYNLNLGKRRADAVANSLKSSIDGLKPNTTSTMTFIVTSKGEAETVSAVNSLNRRVQVCITTVQKPAAPTPTPAPVKPTPIPGIICNSPLSPPSSVITVPISVAQIASTIRSYINNNLILKITKIKAPTAARFLDSSEQAIAKSVFGNSLDFSRIVITDAIGFSGRAFTIVVKYKSIPYVILNLGNICIYNSANNLDTLIHELAHAWQSQHHKVPEAFMYNAVGSMSAATLYEFTLKMNNPFSSVTASPYYYIPGKSFGQYGAEQIAQQVENHFKKKRNHHRILNIIQSAPVNTPIPHNISSMSTFTFELSTTPGVIK